MAAAIKRNKIFYRFIVEIKLIMFGAQPTDALLSYAIILAVLTTFNLRLIKIGHLGNEGALLTVGVK